MSNDAEVRARWSAVLDAQTNADFLTSYTIGADELRALVRIAAEARSHDGEWEAMREAWAKASKFMRHDGLCAIIGGYGYCSCGMDEAKAAMVSAVPLFDEGRL